MYRNCLPLSLDIGGSFGSGGDGGERGGRPAEFKSGLGEASISEDVGTVGEANCSIPIRKDDLEAACCSNQEDEIIVGEDIGASISFIAFIIAGTVSTGVGSGVGFAIPS